VTSKLVQDIYDFNSKAGLLGAGMDSFKELAYVLEESFEGYEGAYVTKDENGEYFKPGDKYYPTGRHLGLSLANSIKEAMSAKDMPLPSEVAEVDKSIDAVWFHIGKLSKMGLTPELIEEAFAAVSYANMSKLGGPKDELGKQLKPEGWVGPEKALEEILSRRPKQQPTLIEDN
jgi:hypothetical protein